LASVLQSNEILLSRSKVVFLGTVIRFVMLGAFWSGGWLVASLICLNVTAPRHHLAV